MAEYRLLNEFGREAVVFAVEPARRCAASCTYCFAALNSASQYGGKAKNLDDPGRLEATASRAFGPNYDPSDLLQWSLRNRLVAGYANTVEPFQDAVQARGILALLDRMGTPLFVQTKTMNVDAVWDHLVPFVGNASIFVSFPTDDDRVLKRFEPGTPKAAERVRAIEKLADAGFHVTLALAPYHERWNADPGGFVRRAASWGVREVFLDRLHLNRRQVRALTDRAIPGVKDPVTVELARSPHNDEFRAHATAIYDACAGEGLDFLPNDFMVVSWGLFATRPAIVPEDAIGRGRTWPYYDGALFRPLEALYAEHLRASDGPFRPLAVRWPDALAAMEAGGRGIDQPFAFHRLNALFAVKNLAPAWKRILGAEAPARDYYRVFWDNPSESGFAFHHPFARLAMRPDGQPWRDDAGDVVLLFDPDDVCPRKGLLATVGELAEVDSLDLIPAD